MSTHDDRRRSVGTTVVGVLAALAAAWCLLAGFVVVSSTLGPDSGDPHGYGVIFGVLMLLMGLPFLLGFGIAWRRLRRR